MRNNHHNPNKVPPFKPDPEHWTKKVHSWKAKVAYKGNETREDAEKVELYPFGEGVYAVMDGENFVA